MSTFQTMISLVLLIFVLSVMVQAIQEVLKAFLNTKSAVLKQIVTDFMGQHLTLQQVEGALTARGLNVTALEHFDKQDFRQLLEGIALQDAQVQGLVATAGATVAQVKDNMAASFEAARGAFLKAYTRKNKLFVVLISFLVVIPLNANVISLYRQISADSVVQQTLVGQASKARMDQSQQGDLKEVYASTHKQISQAMEDYPILLRTGKFRQDFADPFQAIVGLLLMGVLVSLGAPFWNDVLKGLMGINNTFNATRK